MKKYFEIGNFYHHQTQLAVRTSCSVQHIDKLIFFLWLYNHAYSYRGDCLLSAPLQIDKVNFFILIFLIKW